MMMLKYRHYFHPILANFITAPKVVDLEHILNVGDLITRGITIINVEYSVNSYQLLILFSLLGDRTSSFSSTEIDFTPSFRVFFT
jgi:hypothetical protein